jgi:hypothetical protein
MCRRFLHFDCRKVANQRPIGSSKPDIQREEAGSAGIRQISTPMRRSCMSAVGQAKLVVRLRSHIPISLCPQPISSLQLEGELVDRASA